MNPSVKLFILLVCSPIPILVLHMVFSRLFMKYQPNISRHVVFVTCVIVGYIPMAIAIWWLVVRHITLTPYELVLMMVYSLVVYNALSYCYFHIFNMSETARRIRILNEIYKAGQLRTSDIVSLYGVEEMLDARLDRLVKMRQLKQFNGRYMLDQRFLYVVARIIVSVRNLLGFPE